MILQRVSMVKGQVFYPTKSWNEYHLLERKVSFLQQAWKLLLPCFCANVKSPSRKPIDTNCAFLTMCNIADRNTASAVNVCPINVYIYYYKDFEWSIHTKCNVSYESMYSTCFTPTILIFGLYQAFVLCLWNKICQKEGFFVMKFRTVGISRNNDVGPVVSSTSYIQSTSWSIVL